MSAATVCKTLAALIDRDYPDMPVAEAAADVEHARLMVQLAQVEFTRSMRVLLDARNREHHARRCNGAAHD